MKAQAANGRAENGKIPASRLGSSDDTDRIPLGKKPEAGEEGDFFDDVPTLSNGARPDSEPPEEVTGMVPPVQGKGAGAYRLVRPTISDVIETEVQPKPTEATTKRVVLGATRKRR